MGEVAKRTDDEQHEIEDSVLALTEAGWTQREITNELGISSKSIKPYRERALSRIAIPDHDTAVQENIVQLQYVMDECRRRLSDKNLPITATNVPNLLHQFTRARAELNKVLEVGQKQKVEFGLEGTLFDFLKNNTEYYEEITSAAMHEDAKRRDAWMERDDADDLHSADLDRDPADGVFKLPSEFLAVGEDCT